MTPKELIRQLELLPKELKEKPLICGINFHHLNNGCAFILKITKVRKQELTSPSDEHITDVVMLDIQQTDTDNLH